MPPGAAGQLLRARPGTSRPGPWIDSLENTAVIWNGDRATLGLADLSGDETLVGVTEGNQALEVSFNTLSGWVQDFQIKLSPEASATLQAKWQEEAPHRWWLLYDITFRFRGR